MLVDKLKLLNYEKDFCKKGKKPYRKPFSRGYFACPLSSSSTGSEQFFYFTSLVSWLMFLAGVEFSPPKEHDDPNLACSNLVAGMKKLGFASPSFHPQKLTVGFGKEVVGVLEGLVDFVMERQAVAVRRPIYAPDGYNDDGGGDDEAEAAAMEGMDEMAVAESPGYEEEEAYMEPVRSGGGGETVGGSAPRDQADKQMLVSKVDPALWRVELERVAPKLRITLAADSKDWRSHLDEAHQHHQAISSIWPDSKVSLERLRTDLNGSLDKLMTRERYLNEQFDSLMLKYRGSRGLLQDIQDLYNKRTEVISERNGELHRISDQLEDIKGVMDERGSNIADATPVVRIKNAIKKLNEELHDMEVRIGVVSHTLLQLSLKNKRQLFAQALATSDEDDDT
ncbi:MAG: hypothetical protein WDW36_007176 [Sanguina aurantia]